MSKNDNIIRVWTNSEKSPVVPHWYAEDDLASDWTFCPGGHITERETFCLNDAEHTPTGVATDSLDGLIEP